MAKYDLAFKLAVVKAYLAGEGGYQFLANKFGIPSMGTVKKWVEVYSFFGESGLERRRSRKTYSIQFKLDALHYKVSTGESYHDVAFKFGIHEPSIIANWIRVWQKEGIDGLSKPKGRPTMSKKKSKLNKNTKKLTREQELEKENELLRVELAYLKKLRASGINIPSRLRKQNLESSTNYEENID